MLTTSLRDTMCATAAHLSHVILLAHLRRCRPQAMFPTLPGRSLNAPTSRLASERAPRFASGCSSRGVVLPLNDLARTQKHESASASSRSRDNTASASRPRCDIISRSIAQISYCTFSASATAAVRCLRAAESNAFTCVVNAAKRRSKSAMLCSTSGETESARSARSD